jgi:diguanylate cyclase (GGDEF)-like protein/PAS domain S-box-containing protein
MTTDDLRSDMTCELISCLPGVVYRLCYDQGKFSFIYVSEGMEQLCGVTQKKAMEDAESVFSLIHPEDYERVIKESLLSAEDNQVWHGEFRMCLADGRAIWLSSYDRSEHQDDGSILWTGYLIDNSESKYLQESLKKSEAKFRAFVETANDIIYSITLDGRLSYVSPSWKENLGHSVAEVIGRPISDFVHPDDLGRCMQFLEHIYVSGIKQGGIEYRVLHQDGSWRWHTTNASPILDEEGKVSSYLAICHDITERRHTEEQIRHQAHYDPLTDLPNRILLTDRVERALQMAQRQQTQLALLFVDLDRFKPINDTYGHAVGDLMLQEVARRMSDSLRASDIIGRIGGDEFVIVLPLVKEAAAGSKIAEKIISSLNRPYRINGIDMEVSCSIGVSLYPENGKSMLELMRSADEAMYRAKKLSGNRSAKAL